MALLDRFPDALDFPRKRKSTHEDAWDDDIEDVSTEVEDETE